MKENEDKDKVEGTATPTSQSVEKPVEKFYYIKTRGVKTVSYPRVDEDGKKSKSIVKFVDNCFKTDDPQAQKFIEDVMAQEANFSIERKKFLTRDEFDELVTPEKVYVHYKGKEMHVSEVREGLDFAIKNGWKPQFKKKVIMEQRGKITQGGLTAANATRG